MKHLLKLMDLTEREIVEILNTADQLKYEKKNGIKHHILAGKTLGMIFEKSSTRTRVSFEVGMYDLGGTALFLSSRDLQIGRGEPVEDTARVLSRYLDGIMIRTFDQEEVESLARCGALPINADGLMSSSNSSLIEAKPGSFLIRSSRSLSSPSSLTRLPAAIEWLRMTSWSS